MGPQSRRRARKTEDKEERRRAILAAGRALLEDAPFDAVRMADVAKRAKLAKGTVFLYFPTKEALCIDLLDELAGDWFEALDAELHGHGPYTSARLVRALVASLAPRPLLIRLSAILSIVLERNVELEQVVRFKTRLLARVSRTGALLERRVGLPEGEGGRLILRLNALVVGLHQACDLGPVTREALTRPELAPLDIRFEQELPILLGALLRGLIAAH